MHLKPRSDMKVVKKEEKEAQLKAFIDANLELCESKATGTNNTYMLIARSLESPVVRALISLAPELSRAGVTVKLILSAIDGPAPHARMQDEFSNVITVETRVASDPRLFDVHEQLVLANDRVWIGDVMRREPAKRDAYENYCDNCAKTSRWATLAFNRLWSGAKPAPGIRLTGETPTPTHEDFTPFKAASDDVWSQTVTVGTRH